MARLNKAVVIEREELVRNFFRISPLTTVSQANKMLAEKYNGVKMGLRRIYQIQAEVKGFTGEKVSVNVCNDSPTTNQDTNSGPQDTQGTPVC